MARAARVCVGSSLEKNRPSFVQSAWGSYQKQLPIEMPAGQYPAPCSL